MDFNWPTTTIRQLAMFGRCTKACAGILICVCLLNCGCESKPVSNSDSQDGQPAVSGDTNRSDLADDKPVGVANKKTDGDASNSAAPTVAAKPPEPDVNDAQFHAAIETAAEQYLQFAIVNTSTSEVPAAKIAPTLCRGPLPNEVVQEEPAAKMSQAESKSGHGKKLYFLFAKDSGHYLNPDDSESPVGQVLVKESWTAVPGNAGARNLRNHTSGNRVNPRVTVDGETLKLGKRNDLFVMLKQDPKNEATDDGWVYGVIDPKSYEIKSAGAVASCIACHEGERDRLFRDGIIDWNAKAKLLSETDADPDAGDELPKPQKSSTASKADE